jgi:hypothetical protein
MCIIFSIRSGRFPFFKDVCWKNDHVLKIYSSFDFMTNMRQAPLFFSHGKGSSGSTRPKYSASGYLCFSMNIQPWLRRARPNDSGSKRKQNISMRQ